jgi:hypothetical protein
LRRRQRVEAQLRAILAARLMRQIESRVPAVEMNTLVDRMEARTVDPYSAADEVLRAAGQQAAGRGARGPGDES